MTSVSIGRQASCEDEREPDMLSAAAAFAAILAPIEPVSMIEQLALTSALGRVLAGDVRSPLNVPAHINSAVDGFALCVDELSAEGVTTLTIAGDAYAGHPYPGEPASGECVRIMTGAVVPPNCDTVVMKEHTEVVDGQVRIAAGNRRGDNVRQAGEDIEAGAIVLRDGRVLLPADLGLLASLGIAEVSVKRRLRVAFFSTGDEVRSLGDTLASGEIYDSNRYTLHGMLRRLDVEPVDMGVVRDEREALHATLSQASRMADVVITSGGVSVGEADFVRETLAQLGNVDFWKIAIKPGRPLAFGRLGGALFFGLPGNPVAVMVTFYQFVKPALERLMGRQPVPPLHLQARCESRLRKRPGRVEFQRAIMEANEHGELVVRKTGQQGSGVLSSMSQANCFIVMGHNDEGVESGEMVLVQPFAGLI